MFDLTTYVKKWRIRQLKTVFSTLDTLWHVNNHIRMYVVIIGLSLSLSYYLHIHNIHHHPPHHANDIDPSGCLPCVFELSSTWTRRRKSSWRTTESSNHLFYANTITNTITNTNTNTIRNTNMIVKTMRWSNYPCSKHNQRYRTTKTSKMALSNCQPTTNTKRVSQEIHKSREIQIPKKRKWGGSAGGWAGQAGCLQLGGELQLLPTTHFIFRLQPILSLDYNPLYP